MILRHSVWGMDGYKLSTSTVTRTAFFLEFLRFEGEVSETLSSVCSLRTTVLKVAGHDQ